MKRIVLVGVIGLVALTGALILNHYLNRDPLDSAPPAVATGPSAVEPPPVSPSPETSAQPADGPSGRVPPADVAASAPGPRPADGAPAGRSAGEAVPEERPAVVAPKAPAEADTGIAPTFDIVRVNPEGDAVIAGRAEPNAAVVVRDGERIVGEVQADDRGEWVLVPSEPLKPGSRELGIEARSADGTMRRSSSVVVLAVPDRSAGATGGTLAVAVPRSDEVAPSRVLQHPEPAPPAVGGDRELSVGTIDYDDKGKIALSGTASPGSTVEVAVDDRKVGTTTTDGDGEWRMVPKTDVPPGHYTLQVTERDARNGRELARVRLPFARAEPLGEMPPGTVVVVQPGNSLWRIARRTYGDGMRYTLIFAANEAQIRNPDLIYPGQIFSLPRVN